ncbi:MAG: cupin domain-containing protein [Verrucomicrobiota bacterium]
MRFYPRDSPQDWIQGHGYRKQPLLEAGKLACPGTRIQRVEIPPQGSVAAHHHKLQTEVFHFLEGTGYFIVNGRRLDCRPGDVLTVQPGDIHSTHNPGGAPWRYLAFKTNWAEDDLYWDAELA